MADIILIAGATSGFGAACARRFAAAGWQLIPTGRRAERRMSMSMPSRSWSIDQSWGYLAVHRRP